MARHLSESGQGAFTWTGPYGSGKSSLAIALSALLNGDEAKRKHAASLIGGDTAEAIWEAFPPHSRGWHILPIVGRRDRPEQVVGEAYGVKAFGQWPHQRTLARTTGPE